MSALAADDPRHGTYNAYTNHACRCSDCRAANAAYVRDVKARRAPLLPNDPRHGTVNGYRNWNCRCAACREAGTIESRRYHKAVSS